MARLGARARIRAQVARLGARALICAQIARLGAGARIRTRNGPLRRGRQSRSERRSGRASAEARSFPSGRGRAIHLSELHFRKRDSDAPLGAIRARIARSGSNGPIGRQIACLARLAAGRGNCPPLGAGKPMAVAAQGPWVRAIAQGPAGRVLPWPPLGWFAWRPAEVYPFGQGPLGRTPLRKDLFPIGKVWPDGSLGQPDCARALGLRDCAGTRWGLPYWAEIP